jgi:hypothetical protein
MKIQIALGVLLSVLVAGAAANAQPQYPPGYYGQPAGWHGVLSPDDQKQFDKAYSKWLDASRKNDPDDISKNARHMEEIMARYNIPSNTPFDQIASVPAPGGYAAYPNGPYANPAYGWQGRLSPDDQRDFDKDYSKWLDAQRKNDQDDITKNANNMEQIMARYNIPPNVPFAAIASNGYAAGPNAAYGTQYYGQAQRLSPKDQKDFDNHYRKWLEARRKKDIDDIDKNARKMQEIMARYNIPANVPFQQIALEPAY